MTEEKSSPAAASSTTDLDAKPDGPPPGFPEWDPANEGRTGYGQNDPNDPCTSMHGSSDLSDFPAGTSVLEKGSWYNYSLNNQYPPLIAANADENRRVWQQIEFERLMDHQPTHEVHASNLPDYHYWPMIQNEILPKPAFKTDLMTEHHQDESHLPRFFKSGVPKTPRQQQDFFIPLDPKTGRYDWKLNIDRNGYTASLFDKRGWDRRFHVAMNRPQNPFYINGLRNLMNLPIHFRVHELPIAKSLSRAISASYMDRHAMIAGFYLGFLAHMSAGGAHYKALNWDAEPWNYDITFAQFARDKGGFHGVV